MYQSMQDLKTRSIELSKQRAIRAENYKNERKRYDDEQSIVLYGSLTNDELTAKLAELTENYKLHNNALRGACRNTKHKLRSNDKQAYNDLQVIRNMCYLRGL